MKIEKLIHNINTYFLPAIQRKFVWKEDDICKYFDSILRDYPIGWIMLWQVDYKYINKKEITFYKFLTKYNENKKETNDESGNVSKGNSYYAVLDGQQRIQSLVIGLNGYYITKNNIKKELYINLKNDISEDEIEENDDNQTKYQFKFLNQDKIKNNNTWYKVKDILNVKTPNNIRKVLQNYNLNEEEKDQAYDLLYKLKTKINDEDIIKIDEIDSNLNEKDILEIFIRANSAGEPLSRADLLFSTVVLKWDKGRDIIDNFLKEINDTGSFLEFKFTNDFIMRTFLYIKHDDTTMKIEYFKKIADGIEEAWPRIKTSIKTVVKKLRNIGFSDQTIRSYNSIIPLVYYVYNGGKINDNNINEIKKYLSIAQLKRLFGVASNQALKNSKTVLKDKKDFKLSYFYDISFVGNRTFKVSISDLKEWLNFEKDSFDSTLVLRLLYPEYNYGYTTYDKDHAHSIELIENYGNKKFLKYVNKMPNLEILTSTDNREEKHRTPLKEWNKIHPDRYITKDMPLDLKDFMTYYRKRSDNILEKLKETFDIK